MEDAVLCRWIDKNANGLAERYSLVMDVQGTLSTNVRALRRARGLTQDQLAKASGIPRATWAHLETGAANPTLAILVRVAAALQVSIEELISAPRATARLFHRDELRAREKQGVMIRKLLPEALPGLDIERMELPPRARMTGTPHRAGTREYLTCEAGTIVLAASGTKYTLNEGDVVVFRGDQPHSYHNNEKTTAIGYSAVVLAPASD
jgi:XRE family transcriptional regulator, regulator of sulfur utilization